MTKNLDKFFDPLTLPSPSTIEVDLSYFKVVRTKIKVSFSIPNNPMKVYCWDYPLADSLLEDTLKAGIQFVLVEKELYEKKVKELAGS